MKPISPIIPGLEDQEIVIATDQPEYEPLPALPVDGSTVIITRWRLSFRERLVALFNGDIYLYVSTFGQPLQPLYMQVDEPTVHLTMEDANA